MFEIQTVKRGKIRDLSAKLFEDNGSTVTILISPRMKVWEGVSTNFVDLNTDTALPPINYFNFYTHQTAVLALTFITWATANARSKLAEVSKYFPVYMEKDGTVNVSKAAGGLFTVQKNVKTIFWMKIVSRPDQPQDFTRLETHHSRIEYGSVVPTQGAGKYDQSGNLSYNTYIPFLSVTPDDKGLNVEYFDIGELKHFSPTYYSIQNGVRRDLMFSYGKISPYRKT